MVIQHLNQIRKVRKLSKWVCLTSWLKIKKIIALRCHLLLFYTQQEIISRSDCDVQWKVDFIRQLAMTSLVAGPRRSSKALPKAKLAPKKGHGHCLAPCCLSDPLHLSESWRNHYTWEVCSANRRDALKTATQQSIEWVQFFPQTSDCTSHKQRFNSWTSWATEFCLIHHTPLTSRHWLSLLQASRQCLAGKMLP